MIGEAPEPRRGGGRGSLAGSLRLPGLFHPLPSCYLYYNCTTSSNTISIRGFFSDHEWKYTTIKTVCQCTGCT
eukprot:2021873-Rhodomonas_salina.1